MTKTPNLFDYAYKEMSQDGFFSWLLAWASAEHKEKDQLLHDAGKAFLNMLLKNSDRADLINTKFTTHVLMQYKSIDVFCILTAGEQNYYLIIEDKVGSTEHDNQLARYKDAAKEPFFIGKTQHNPSESQLICCYIQTHAQAYYQNANTAAYSIIRTQDIINCLKSFERKLDFPQHNNILLSGITHFKSIQARLDAYKTIRFAEWKGDALKWYGLFEQLQKKFDDSGWGYVPNQSSGFYGFWWHFDCFYEDTSDEYNKVNQKVYLQIQDTKLVVKIGGIDTERAAVRNKWYNCLMSTQKFLQNGLKVKKPVRFGNGDTMTVVEFDLQNWIILKDGVVVLDATIARLKEAEKFLDAALKNYKSTD